MKIAVDLGGTNLRMAQVEGSSIKGKRVVPCQAQADANVLVEQIAGIIREGMTEDVDGIGIGVPSVVDAERGVVYSATNISSWKEVPLKEELEKRLGLPVRVNNDCNCFALGEARYGAGKPFSHFLGITLGTGVGTGIIIDKKLYSGVCTGAGEIGALPYQDSDFEAYCSSRFFKMHNTSGEEAYRLALSGDKQALELWHSFGMHLGKLVNAVLYAYAPEAVVLGGGLAAAMSLFEKSMREVVDGFPYGMISNQLQILPAKLEDASLLGAALLFE